MSSNEVPFRKYWRINPFMFSFAPGDLGIEIKERVFETLSFKFLINEVQFIFSLIPLILVKFVFWLKKN